MKIKAVKETPKRRGRTHKLTGIDCPRCGGKETVFHGTRYVARGDIQRFKCLRCAYCFSENTINFMGWGAGRPPRVTEEIMLYILTLYAKGHSSRDISKKVYAKFKMTVHYNTVMRYVNASDITKPNVSKVYSEENIQTLKDAIKHNKSLIEQKLQMLNMEKECTANEYREKIKKINEKIDAIQEAVKNNLKHLARLEEVSKFTKPYINKRRDLWKRKLSEKTIAYFQRVREKNETEKSNAKGKI
mgnify:CR=1 FL=1